MAIDFKNVSAWILRERELRDKYYQLQKIKNEIRSINISLRHF